MTRKMNGNVKERKSIVRENNLMRMVVLCVVLISSYFYIYFDYLCLSGVGMGSMRVSYSLIFEIFVTMFLLIYLFKTNDVEFTLICCGILIIAFVICYEISGVGILG